MTDFSPRKLTLLYQNPATPLRGWYEEIFAPWIKDVVEDGSHTVVMDDCIVSESFLQTQDPAYFARFAGKNAFLLLSPDEYYNAPFALYRHFCGVFRSHYSAAYSPKRVMQMPTGYNPGFERQELGKPASERKYIWSFLGQVNKSTRPECLRSLLQIEPHCWYASDGWSPHAKRPSAQSDVVKPTEQYIEILRESVFTPCPLGNVSQESLRVYEALQVGSIPVLERRSTMDAHRSVLGEHPLPTFASWKKAAAWMREIAGQPHQIDQLQRDCMAWWTDYKLRLSGEIGEFLGRLQDHPSTPETRYVAPYASLPGWSLFELTRHHTPRAFLRRLELTAVRLARTRKLFIHS